MEFKDLSSHQRAAIALVAFGPEVASLVLKGMSEQEIEKITGEIANLRDVPPEVEEMVITECHDIFMARQYVSQGGVDYAKTVLEKAVGPMKAMEIMGRLESTLT